eukprot:379621_1
MHAYGVSVDLVECKKELNVNQNDIKKQIETDRELFRKFGNEFKIRAVSRRNFELEMTLSVLDKQIPLLIQNMINISELNDMTEGVLRPSNTNLQCISPLSGKKQLYEQLFYILQNNPKYFALLTKQVKATETSDYVKTIIFDIYGSQYDYNEEHLLLTLFQNVLKQTFDESQNIDTILKENTVTTQMLRAFTRRGEGLCILREILGKPIRKMLDQTSLNLEINPIEVYKQIIRSYEAKMNKPWDGIRNPTSNEAANNKYVKRLIAPRIKQLEYITQHIIQKIIETVNSIPFGIKWICRQIVEMTQQKFPNDNKYQVVGKYICLRFYIPAIITPESIPTIVKKKLSKTMRRNLILVAKILENLFTGIAFGDTFMNPLSNCVGRHHKDIGIYFSQLINVHSLSNRKDICNLFDVPSRARDCTIQISFNQIFLVHRLLLKHRKEWNPHNDADNPVLKILTKLGPAPNNLKHSENHSINMRLSSDIEVNKCEKVGNDDSQTLISCVPFVNNIRDVIRELLLNESIPQIFLTQHRKSLKSYLYCVRDWARSNGNSKVLTDAEAVINGMNKYMTSRSIIDRNNDEGFNNFLVVYMNEIQEMKQSAETLHSKIISVQKTRDTIMDYYNYLHEKLRYYQLYIAGVKDSTHSGDKSDKNKLAIARLDCLLCGYLKENFSEKLIIIYPISLNNIFIYYLKILFSSYGKPIKYSH